MYISITQGTYPTRHQLSLNLWGWGEALILLLLRFTLTLISGWESATTVNQWFSNSGVPENHLEGLLKFSPTPRASDSVRLGQPLKICIFSKFPDDDNPAGVWTTLWEPLFQTIYNVSRMNEIINVGDTQIEKHEHYTKNLNIKKEFHMQHYWSLGKFKLNPQPQWNTIAYLLEWLKLKTKSKCPSDGEGTQHLPLSYTADENAKWYATVETSL